MATDLASYKSNNQIASTNARGVTAIPGYDASGDMTSDGVNQYLYDGEGRICAVASTPIPGMTALIGYLYDADGTRVAKGRITAMSCDPTANGFQFTENYVLGPSGEVLTTLDGTNTWQRTNVYAAGKLLATYDTAGLHFHLTDSLGTRRMQLSGNLVTLGQPETDIQSLPFGDQLNTYPDQYAPATADDSTPLHFTGKERDAESGNDYFGARYYASSMGRFLSADPLIMESRRLVDPQQLNLYAYGRNNPFRYTDPTGLDINLNCSQVSAATCSGIVGDFNNRKGAQFTVGRDEKTGLLTAEGKDPSKLSSGEAALYGAIQDQGNHATLSVVSQSDNVQFGLFNGNGHNTIDASDLSLLNKASPQAAGKVLSHEALEAYHSSLANGSYDESHAYANQFFGQAISTRLFTIAPPNAALLPSQSNQGFYQDQWLFGRINQTFTTGVRSTGPMPQQGYQPGIIDTVNKVPPQ